MKLSKRIEELENRISPKELPSAWSALVQTDGTVKASHIKHGEYDFDSMEEFKAFKDEKGIKQYDCIDVIVVNARNAKGERSKEK